MIPGDWLGIQLHRFFPKQDSTYFRQIVAYWVTFPLMNLAAIACVYWLLRLLEFGDVISGLSSLIFLVCTTFLHYAQSTQQNNQIFLLVILGYTTGLLALQSGKSKWLFISGLSFGFSYLIRSSSLIHIFFALAFLVSCYLYKNYNYVKIVKSLLRILGGLLPGLILARLLNYWRFGSIWVTGQMLSIKQAKEDISLSHLPPLPKDYPWDNPIYEGIIGVLFTPAKSIFIYDPLLLPCLVIGIIYWQQVNSYIRLYLITAFFSLMANIVAFGKLDFWHGDAAWGARYHVTSVHLLLIPLIAISLERVFFNLTTKVLLKRLGAFLLVLSLIFQLMSLVFKPSTESGSIYFAKLEEFKEFRLFNRAKNIFCIVTSFPSQECQEKLTVNDYRNLKPRLSLFPFLFKNLKDILFPIWIILMLTAIALTLRFWSAYVL